MPGQLIRRQNTGLSRSQAEASEAVKSQSDAVAILGATAHIVRFLALSGSTDDFDFRKREQTWDSGSHPDELLIKVPGGRYVLMHVPVVGPERVHIEITGGDAAWWIKTEMAKRTKNILIPPTTGRIADWRLEKLSVAPRPESPTPDTTQVPALRQDEKPPTPAGGDQDAPPAPHPHGTENEFKQIIGALAHSRKLNSSRLVALMSKQRPWEDGQGSLIAHADWDYVLRECTRGNTVEAMKTLLYRTNNELLDLGGPGKDLARRLKFSLAGDLVTMTIKSV
jgi:hypothetical protein